MTKFKWGFIGTGNIARAMASALHHVPGADRFAVASRSDETARTFAIEFGFDRAYSSYDALMADQDIDIVYVATPNDLHKKNILSALAAGKHVLCEKPMTLSVADSEQCFAAAREAGLFLMEAFWTAFFPAMRKAIEIIRSGEIGTPCHFTANFVSLRTRMPIRSCSIPRLAVGRGMTWASIRWPRHCYLLVQPTESLRIRSSVRPA